MSTGKIVQVMGPVVDVAFESGDLPEIYTALEILQKDDRVICEVQQHLGESTVRTVSMGSTDGLSRGMDVKDLGEPITTPVGKAVLGRIINVTGDPVDEAGPITADARWSIHRDAPPFEEQVTEAEMLVTGVKVMDLLCPFLKGGRLVCSVVQVLVKQLLSWNSSVTLPRSMVDFLFSQVLVNEHVKEMTSGMK